MLQVCGSWTSQAAKPSEAKAMTLESMAERGQPFPTIGRLPLPFALFRVQNYTFFPNHHKKSKDLWIINGSFRGNPCFHRDFYPFVSVSQRAMLRYPHPIRTLSLCPCYSQRVVLEQPLADNSGRI